MAQYGITSESQLIDYETIRNGCQAYVDAASEMAKAADQIQGAGDICDKKALAANGESMQTPIYEFAQQVAMIASECAARASDVVDQAVRIYNEQVQELNAYRQRLADEQARQQQQQNNGTN